MAKLRVYITRWYDHLIDFEDTSAIMFLSRCVTPEFKELVLSHHKLEPCLQVLATYCANEEMYCKRKLEEMKSASLSKGYRDDKELISMFDKKLIDTMSINSSYQIEFSTVIWQIKKRLRSGLEDVKTKDKDFYNTNNYLMTLSHC